MECVRLHAQRKWSPGMCYWKEGWVNPTAGMEAEEMRQVPCPCRTEVKYEQGPLNVKWRLCLAFGSVKTLVELTSLTQKNVTRRDGKKVQTDTTLACVNIGRSHSFPSIVDRGWVQLPPRSFVFVTACDKGDINSEAFALFSWYICQILQSQVLITTLYLW